MLEDGWQITTHHSSYMHTYTHPLTDTDTHTHRHRHTHRHTDTDTHAHTPCVALRARTAVHTASKMNCTWPTIDRSKSSPNRDCITPSNSSRVYSNQSKKKGGDLPQTCLFHACKMDVCLSAYSCFGSHQCSTLSWWADQQLCACMCKLTV